MFSLSVTANPPGTVLAGTGAASIPLWLELITPNTVNPPRLRVISGAPVAGQEWLRQGDTVQLRWSHSPDFAAVLGTASRVMGAAETNGTSISNGGWGNVTQATYFQVRAVQADGSTTDWAGDLTVQTPVVAPPPAVTAFTGLISLTDSLGSYQDNAGELHFLGGQVYWTQAIEDAYPAAKNFRDGQPSRSLGTPGEKDNNGNTHWGQFTEIANLIAVNNLSDVVLENGANHVVGWQASDNPASKAAALISDTKAFIAALNAAVIAAGKPAPRWHLTTMVQTYTADPNFATFEAGRIAVNAAIYAEAAAANPAWVSVWPFGEHPGWSTEQGTIYADNLHWPAPGQTLAGAIAVACAGSIISNSPTQEITATNWLGADAAATAGEEKILSYLVSGLAPGRVVQAGAVNPDADTSARVGAGAFGAGQSAARNGSLVQVKQLAGAAGSSRIAAANIGTNTDSVTISVPAGGAAVGSFSTTAKHAAVTSAGAVATIPTGSGFIGARAMPVATSGKRVMAFQVTAISANAQAYFGITEAANYSGFTTTVSPAPGSGGMSGLNFAGYQQPSNMEVAHPSSSANRFPYISVGAVAVGDIVVIAHDPGGLAYVGRYTGQDTGYLIKSGVTAQMGNSQGYDFSNPTVNQANLAAGTGGFAVSVTDPAFFVGGLGFAVELVPLPFALPAGWSI